MSLNVLRSEGEDGNEMMRLVRYGVGSASDATTGNDKGSLAAGSDIP